MSLLCAQDAKTLADNARKQFPDLDVSRYIDSISAAIHIAAEKNGLTEYIYRETLDPDKHGLESVAIKHILESHGYTVYATHPKSMDAKECATWTFVIKWDSPRNAHTDPKPTDGIPTPLNKCWTPIVHSNGSIF